MFNLTRHAEREREWEAFEAEALPHMAALFRVAMWLAHERAAAEDLVQETFAQALASFQRYEKGTNCRAWLVKIMYHMNGKRLRGGSRLRLVSDTEERIAETIAYEPPTPQGVSDEDVLAALARIPQQFQEVVVLSDVEEMSYREIADALRIPVGTVMSRLHRGRKLLRADLARYAGEHGFGRPEDGGELSAEARP